MNFSGVLLTDSDPIAESLRSVWRKIYTGEFNPPTLLKLSTPTMEFAFLGDWVAFMVSHGAVDSRGRLLALSLRIVQQVGDWMRENQVARLAAGFLRLLL